MAGGPSTPALALACSDAGALGFLAGGYLRPEDLQRQMAELSAAGAVFGVNLFMPTQGGAADVEQVRQYAERIRPEAERLGASLGEPRHSDDQYPAKLALLLQADPAPAIVSFTFGCPSAEVVQQLQRRGTEAWVTVTTPAEAAQALEAGANALIAQGVEAGGHRGAFVDEEAEPVNYGLMALLQLVRARHPSADLVASGGIMTGTAVASVQLLGARAAQMGSAFLLADEAGSVPAHRRAVASDEPTGLSRAWSGRLARGILNRFQRAHSAAAPRAYPEVHLLTSPLRATARKAEDSSAFNLFAGEAHVLACSEPAKAIVARIERERRQALAQAGSLTDKAQE